MDDLWARIQAQNEEMDRMNEEKARVIQLGKAEASLAAHEAYVQNPRAHQQQQWEQPQQNQYGGEHQQLCKEVICHRLLPFLQRELPAACVKLFGSSVGLAERAFSFSGGEPASRPEPPWQPLGWIPQNYDIAVLCVHVIGGRTRRLVYWQTCAVCELVYLCGSSKLPNAMAAKHCDRRS